MYQHRCALAACDAPREGERFGNPRRSAISLTNDDAGQQQNRSKGAVS